MTFIVFNLVGLELLTDSDGHEDGGHEEGEGEALVLAEARLLPEDGRQDGGDHRAKVDGGVEDAEEGAHLGVLLGQLELVGAEGDDARLDAARAEADQDQAGERDSPKDRIVGQLLT